MIESCGTPDPILEYENNLPFNTTLCFISSKKSVRVLKRLLDKWFCFILKIGPLCYTLSKPLEISKNADQTS